METLSRLCDDMVFHAGSYSPVSEPAYPWHSNICRCIWSSNVVTSCVKSHSEHSQIYRDQMHEQLVEWLKNHAGIMTQAQFAMIRSGSPSQRSWGYRWTDAPRTIPGVPIWLQIWCHSISGCIWTAAKLFLWRLTWTSQSFIKFHLYTAFLRSRLSGSGFHCYNAQNSSEVVQSFWVNHTEIHQ